MQSTPRIRLDVEAERLWRDGQPVGLRPKSWDVLRYLVMEPGRLVTKRELLDAVWPGIAVTEGTLNKSIGELRVALADDKRQPRFIETVPRRGFRWIGAELLSPSPASGESGPVPTGNLAEPTIIAREHELAVLETLVQRMLAGERQVVFVVGEAGGGKSTLVDAFTARHRAAGEYGALAIGQGQCIDAFGQHEPYLPVIEALEQLLRADPSGVTAQALQRRAPAWQAILPALGPPKGDASGRMASAPSLLRELVRALEEMSASQPLVLVLEDAHASDLATVDFCNFLARRREAARILLIVTLRPADAVVRNHPIAEIKAELAAKRLARVLEVQPFSAGDVGAYVRDRVPQSFQSDSFVHWIHHQTGGNPFFVRAVTDELRAQGIDVATEQGNRVQRTETVLRWIPDNLRELLERRLSRLPQLQLTMVEAASVLMTSDLATEHIAAVAEVDPQVAEEQCLDLARHRDLLTQVHDGPDTVRGPASRFRFLHGLVQTVVYDRLPRTRRRHMHVRFAEWLERTAGDRVATLAPQLGFHFEMGGNTERALHYLELAAASAIEVGAARDAVTIRQRRLTLLQSQAADGKALANAKLSLAQARQIAFGFADPDVEVLLREALRAAEERQALVQQFSAAVGLHPCLNIAARYAEAEVLSRRLLSMASASGFPPARQIASVLAASTFYRQGRFREAHAQLEESLALDGLPLSASAFDVKATATALAAVVSVQIGRTTQARTLAQRALDLVAESGPYNECVINTLAGETSAFVGDYAAVESYGDRALGLAIQHGFEGWIASIRFLRGWAAHRLGRIEEGLSAMREAHGRGLEHGIQMDHSLFCAMFADELMHHDVVAAEAVIADGIAFAERTGEGHSEAELYRLRGLMGLRTRGDARACEVELRKAIECARGRGAHWSELRAALAYAQLTSGTDRREAGGALASALSHFEADDPLPTVAEARATLAERGGGP